MMILMMVAYISRTEVNFDLILPFQYLFIYSDIRFSSSLPLWAGFPGEVLVKRFIVCTHKVGINQIK